MHQKTTYLSFARKWRPQIFAELVGQDIICETLKKSIAKNQTAQSFLFCGGRGTGKTSCARIFAKALNCNNSVDSEPCNSCENCQEINKDCAIDVIEIDAASNRGIDHIRKIRTNLTYLPIKCKFKIYIIDEVHMLTIESFNALLKSIEEPPNYIKFVLATTHPHKIPDTILSRCQRYNFYKIAYQKIENHLKKIAKAEAIEINNNALAKIIQISDGALRDALINFEMIYSFCGNNITEDAVAKILQTTNETDLEALLVEIIKQNTTASLKKFSIIMDQGIPLQIFITDFLSFIHKASLQKTSNNLKVFVTNTQNALQQISLSKLQQYFQILLEVEEQIKTSKMTTLCVEMGILKLCSISDFARIQDILTQLEKNKQHTNATPSIQENTAQLATDNATSTKIHTDHTNATPSIQENTAQLATDNATSTKIHTDHTNATPSIQENTAQLATDNATSTKIHTDHTNATPSIQENTAQLATDNATSTKIHTDHTNATPSIQENTAQLATDNATSTKIHTDHTNATPSIQENTAQLATDNATSTKIHTDHKENSPELDWVKSAKDIFNNS